jgi:hypothetical protein
MAARSAGVAVFSFQVLKSNESSFEAQFVMRTRKSVLRLEVSAHDLIRTRVWESKSEKGQEVEASRYC